MDNHLSDEDITELLFVKERDSKFLEKVNEHLILCSECFDNIVFMKKVISTINVNSTALPVFIFSPSLRDEGKSCFGNIGFSQEMIVTPTLSSEIGYKSRKIKVQLSKLSIEYSEYGDEVDFKFNAKETGSIVVYNKSGLILKKKMGLSEDYRHTIQKNALVLVWNDNVLYLFFGYK